MCRHKSQDTKAEELCTGIPVEILFSTPFFAKPGRAQFCDFVRECQNCLKNKDLPEIINFKKDAEKNAIKWKIWPTGSSWKEILGDEHFKLLSSYQDHDKNKSKSPKQIPPGFTTSVVELVAKIRNKSEHSGSFTDDEKQSLGWFHWNSASESWLFDKILYAKYWTTRFPQLEPFLWWQFRYFRKVELKEYYPCYCSSVYSGDIDLFEFPITESLAANLEQGTLERRLIAENGDGAKDWILEWRMLPDHLVQRVLCGSSLAEIKITNGSVVSNWYDLVNKSETLKDERKVQISLEHSFVNINLLFVENCFCDLDPQSMAEKFIDCSSDRVVIFTSVKDDTNAEQRVIINSLVEYASTFLKVKLTEAPIRFQELGETCRQAVINKSEYVIQGKVVGIKDIFQKDDIDMWRFCSGDLLNKVLMGERPTLFERHELPSVPSIYINRMLTRQIIVHLNILLANIDVFCLTNIALKDLEEKMPILKGKVSVSKNLGEKVPLLYRIILLENIPTIPPGYKLEYGNEIIFDGPKNIDFSNISIHTLHYLQGNVFLWRHTTGPVTLFEKLVPNFCNEIKSISEENLLDKILTSERIERLIFIADEPGFGKSLVLNKLALRMVEKISDRIIVNLSMNEFMEKLDVKICTKENIVKAFKDILCSNEFEEILIENLLHEPERDKWSFIILFDGFDEIKAEIRQIAVNVLKKIRHELPSVMVLVTLREHVIEEIFYQFHTSPFFKLEPFSSENQIDFMEQIWLEKFKDANNAPNSMELRDFAEKCTKIPLHEFDRIKLQKEVEITDNPLQCRMLADIYEDKVLSKDFSLNGITKMSLATLYELLIDRKLEVYIRQKKRLSHISMTDPIINTLHDQLHLSHAYFAMKLLISEDIANEFKNRLILTVRSNEELESMVLAQGIIIRLNPLTFLHRTLAEYILARFIHQVMLGYYLHITKDDATFQSLLWNKVLVTLTQLEVRPKDDGESEYFSHLKFQTICHFMDDLYCNNEKNRLDVLQLEPHFKTLLGKTFSFLRDICTWLQELCKRAPVFAAANRWGYYSVVFHLLNSPRHITGLLIIALEHWSIEFVDAIINGNVGITPENWSSKLQEYEDNGFGVLHWVAYAIAKSPSWPGAFPLIKVVDYCVQKDTEALEKKDKRGRAPLFLILEESNCNKFYFCATFICTMIRNFKVNLNCTDNSKNTVLHVTNVNVKSSKNEEKQVFVKAYTDVMECVMETGPSETLINSINVNGNTPFLSALEHFEDATLHTVEYFQKYGADLNAKNKNGSTALHLAIEKRFSVDLIKKLVMCGACMSAKDGKGKCALELAIEQKHFKAVSCLVEDCEADLEVVKSDISTEMRDFIRFLKKKLRKKAKKGSKRL